MLIWDKINQKHKLSLESSESGNKKDIPKLWGVGSKWRVWEVVIKTPSPKKKSVSPCRWSNAVNFPWIHGWGFDIFCSVWCNFLKFVFGFFLFLPLASLIFIVTFWRRDVVLEHFYHPVMKQAHQDPYIHTRLHYCRLWPTAANKWRVFLLGKDRNLLTCHTRLWFQELHQIVTCEKDIINNARGAFLFYQVRKKERENMFPNTKCGIPLNTQYHRATGGLIN